MTFASYADFHNSLQLKCEEAPKETAGILSTASVFRFRPDSSMPDTLYYQSFMAKHLGGVIRLTNKCFAKSKASTAKALPTFRPALASHLSEQSAPAKPASLAPPLPPR